MKGGLDVVARRVLLIEVDVPDLGALLGDEGDLVLFLEDLGFCRKGEGGPFVTGGRIAPGGSLAVNTNGGGLSYCHPGMYGLLLLIEAVRQLRGDAGDRQVPGEPKVGFAQLYGAPGTAGATIVTR